MDKSEKKGRASPANLHLYHILRQLLQVNLRPVCSVLHLHRSIYIRGIVNLLKNKVDIFLMRFEVCLRLAER